MTTPENTHFYASSVAQWATTNETRDLRALLKLMDKDGYPYNLFFVPLSHKESYEIKRYEPKVEGAQWLGFYEMKDSK
jgi:hypothetical protein